MEKWIAFLLLIGCVRASADCGVEPLRRLVNSAALRSSVENLRAGRAVDDTDLMRAIVANAPELPAIEKSVLSAKTAEAERLRQGFGRANEKVQAIRGAYPELANVAGEDEARLIALIARLEERRAPPEKIREALARGKKACRIP